MPEYSIMAMDELRAPAVPPVHVAVTVFAAPPMATAQNKATIPLSAAAGDSAIRFQVSRLSATDTPV
jgi:hypothetical protein